MFIYKKIDNTRICVFKIKQNNYILIVCNCDFSILNKELNIQKKKKQLQIMIPSS